MARQLISVCLCFLVALLTQLVAGAKSDQVLLQDVKAITLHHGQMTNARRSAPVPQLKCVGGTAVSHAFRPKTVQCINRGSDGYDVQWECKADMDNSYRFGKLEVSCEGYSYPDDPYILRGSCGLEYTLDLTEEGHERKNSQHYGSHGKQYDDSYHYRADTPHSYTKKASSVVKDLIHLGIVAGVIYIVYKKCIAPRPADGPPTGDPPSYEETFRSQQGGQQPPPYGFRQEYMPNTGGCTSGAGYSSSQTFTPPGHSTGGGFWSGVFSGGLMGYLFGRSNTYAGYQRPHTGWWGNRGGWGTGWGSGWGNNWGSSWGNGGGWGSSRTYTTTSSSRSSSPRSSGTRTASGFASTSRR